MTEPHDINLGISLDYPERWEPLVPEWAPAPLRGLQHLEIPGCALPFPEAWQNALRAWNVEIGVRSLMPAGFIRQAASERGRIFDEFKERFRERLRLAAHHGIGHASADFDLDHAGRDPEYRGLLTRTIPGFYQPLEECGLLLYLSLRLPAFGGSCEHYHTVWKCFRHPRLKLAVDLYIHECAGREAELIRFLETWRFDIGILRFHYEPELGNRLVAKHLIDYIRPVIRYGLPVTVFASPVCIQRTALNGELRIVQELASELTQNIRGAKEEVKVC